MDWFFAAIITAITAFFASNLDDIIVLMLFFSQLNATFHRRHIVIGQYLGFTIIIIASLPGYFGGLLVPPTWLGLLGLLPVAIGISRLVEQKRSEEVQTVTAEFDQTSLNTPFLSTIANILSPQTYKVAAITIANGGDNIGIYIPIFASSNSKALGVFIVVFFLLVGVWCYVAYHLSRHPAVAHILTRYGHAIVPFFLIGLGIYILVSSGTLIAIFNKLHTFQTLIF